MSLVKKVILIVFIVIFISLALFLAKIAELAYTPVEMHHKLCEIKTGDTGRDIAKTLYKKNIIKNEDLFYIIIRFKKLDRTLKAGHYLFTGKLNMFDTIEKIVSGEILVERITIPEGLSLYRTLKIISDHGIGDYETYLKYAKNPAFASEITNFEVDTLEGFLYPDTYIFGFDMAEESVLRAMVRNFYTRLAASSISIEDKEEFYRDLTLASIVEKEAIFNDEKPLIAGVYLNRMRIGMRLQADPTVTYHLEPDFIHKRLITYRDTRKETPYNTYVISGLPPHPICSPAISSLFAVKHPEKSKYLFFFANKRGRHIFSETYAEHLRKQRDRK